MSEDDSTRPTAGETSPSAPAPTPLTDEITPWMHGLAWLTRVGLAGLTRVRLEGALDAIPKDGPIILAANHASNLDPVVMAAVVLPKVGRRFQWLGKKELFGWLVVGWVARNGGVHPVDRGAADVEAFRLAKRILDEGHILFVFPEGTRSADGKLQEARDGTAVLALRTDAPILPVGIAGSHGVWPRGQKLQPATTHIMRRIAALLPPEQRGPYADADVQAIRPPAPPER
jgi:1-acyl-sn-glycerol-3-phosphate acyltransferase